MKKVIISLLPAFFFISMFMFTSGPTLAQEVGAWVAPVEADKLANPVKGEKDALLRGRVIYTNDCVVCHGANGDGVSFVANNLEQKPKNFTVEDFQNQSDGAIFWKLSEGRGLMQPFKTMLTDEEIWSLVEYVKFLAKDGG